MKRILSVFASAILAALFAVTAPNVSAAQPAKGQSTAYTFAVIPYYTPEKIWTLFSPFVDYLNKTTGHQWKLKLYHNHEEFVEDMCNGNISLAFTGPVPLGRAYNRCGTKPLLVALNKGGKSDYHSVLVTTDPTVKSISDLKGKTVGFFKGSTAAHILPVKMLKNSGISLSDIQPVFLESQDRIFTSLLSGELAAGGMKEALYRKGGVKLFRVLATSEALPNFALASSPSLPDKVQSRLVSSLRNLKPLTSSNDAEFVKTWDDEIKYGFIDPPKDFLPAVINLYSTYWEVTNENK